MADHSWTAIEAIDDQVPEAAGPGTGAILAKDLSAFIAAHGGVQVTIEGQTVTVINFAHSARAVTIDARAVAAGTSGGAERIALLVAAIEGIQAEQADIARPALLKAMLTADIDPVPSATIAQARRLAQQRERLLASGAFTIDALRELRGDAKPSATRTWLTRRRAVGELFTVNHDGTALVPAFQLDAEAQPRPGVAAVLEALGPAELTPWATWTWFTATTPWLGGAAPVDLLETSSARVASAARRFASNAA